MDVPFLCSVTIQRIEQLPSGSGRYVLKYRRGSRQQGELHSKEVTPDGVATFEEAFEVSGTLWALKSKGFRIKPLQFKLVELHGTKRPKLLGEGTLNLADVLPCRELRMHQVAIGRCVAHVGLKDKWQSITGSTPQVSVPTQPPVVFPPSSSSVSSVAANSLNDDKGSSSASPKSQSNSDLPRVPANGGGVSRRAPPDLEISTLRSETLALQKALAAQQESERMHQSTISKLEKAVEDLELRLKEQDDSFACQLEAKDSAVVELSTLRNNLQDKVVLQEMAISKLEEKVSRQEASIAAHIQSTMALEANNADLQQQVAELMEALATRDVQESRRSTLSNAAETSGFMEDKLNDVNMPHQLIDRICEVECHLKVSRSRVEALEEELWASRNYAAQLEAMVWRRPHYSRPKLMLGDISMLSETSQQQISDSTNTSILTTPVKRGLKLIVGDTGPSFILSPAGKDTDQLEDVSTLSPGTPMTSLQASPAAHVDGEITPD